MACRAIGLTDENADYLNALLQCLFHLPAVRSAILSLSLDGTANPEVCVPLAWQRLFAEMQRNLATGRPCSCQELIGALGWGPPELRYVQDVEVILRILLRVLKGACCVTEQPDIVQELFTSKERVKVSLTVLESGGQRQKQRWNIQQYSVDGRYRIMNLPLLDQQIVTNVYQGLELYMRPPADTADYQDVITDLNEYLEHDIGSPERCNAQYETRAVRQQAGSQQQDQKHECQQQLQHIDQQQRSVGTDPQEHEVIHDTDMHDVAADQSTDHDSTNPEELNLWPLEWPTTRTGTSSRTSDETSATIGHAPPQPLPPDFEHSSQANPRVLTLTDIEFIKLPPVLVLYLGRQVPVRSRSSDMYLKHCVQYPEFLDLSSFCKGNRFDSRRLQTAGGRRSMTEQLLQCEVTGQRQSAADQLHCLVNVVSLVSTPGCTRRQHCVFVRAPTAVHPSVSRQQQHLGAQQMRQGLWGQRQQGAELKSHYSPCSTEWIRILDDQMEIVAPEVVLQQQYGLQASALKSGGKRASTVSSWDKSRGDEDDSIAFMLMYVRMDQWERVMNCSISRGDDGRSSTGDSESNDAIDGDDVQQQLATEKLLTCYKTLLESNTYPGDDGYHAETLLDYLREVSG